MTNAAIGFTPGWDRVDPLTLQFDAPELEGSYVEAMAGPARQRLRIACLIAMPLWIGGAVLGPILVGVSLVPIALAAAVNILAEAGIILLTLGRMRLHQVWLAASFLATLGALGVIVSFWDDTFPYLAAVALVTNAVTAIGLVRPAAWIGGLLAAISLALFAIGSVALGSGPVAIVQGFLVAGTLAMAVSGARYLESAERTSFASGYLVADLHRRIDRLFRQYLSPDVAQSLVEDPTRAELGGQVTEVTVLFADLSGYTAYSENLAPSEVVQMLNASFAAAVPAVFHEGGTIVAFAGDSLMAIFNAPLTQTDHALRACRAALALQRAVGAVGSGNKGDAGGRQPMFRVGINTGPALVGNIGSDELRNFSALGDTTNVAARFQTFAAPGRIVIGQPTFELVREATRTHELGFAELKGKSIPVAIYDLVGLA